MLFLTKESSFKILSPMAKNFLNAEKSNFINDKREANLFILLHDLGRCREICEAGSLWYKYIAHDINISKKGRYFLFQNITSPKNRPSNVIF